MSNQEINKVLQPVLNTIKSKKTKLRFRRHRCGEFKRLGERWVRPKGIDNKVRRHFRGTARMPGKEFRQEEEARHLNKLGYREVLVQNTNDLEPLKTLNTYYAAVIAHGVGTKKRIDIIRQAEEYNIIVMNKDARVFTDKEE